MFQNASTQADGRAVKPDKGVVNYEQLVECNSSYDVDDGMAYETSNEELTNFY